jgi:hypothetical protein
LECDGSGRRFGSPSEDELLRATKSREGLSRVAYRRVSDNASVTRRTTKRFCASGNLLECDGSGRRFGSPSEDELLRATKSREGLSRLAYRQVSDNASVTRTTTKRFCASGNLLECDGSGRRFGSPSEDELLRATKSLEGLSRLAYRRVSDNASVTRRTTKATPRAVALQKFF